MGLLVLVAGTWLVLLTFAIVGLNVRLHLLKQDLMEARGVSREEVEARRASTGLAPGTVVLLVSETCGSCTEAIDALEALARDGALGSRPLFVLTPDPDDRRVRAPLVALTDDALYRRLYEKVTPTLIVIDDDGRPGYRAAVRDAAELPDLLREADALGRPQPV